MLNGLDLFSGIGGLSLALGPYVRPIAYCESDGYAQSVLLSRMRDERLSLAPIWDDVRTLHGRYVPGKPDIIYGGFPCQDISVAGNGAGLEGERSGLFFEVCRLVDEIKPPFVFLENVPAIRTRGGERVGKELAIRGYDCRWTVLSAADVGAPHLRKRWFLLAYRNGDRFQVEQKCHGEESQGSGTQRSDAHGFRDALSYTQREQLWDEQGRGSGANREGPAFPGNPGANSLVNTEGVGRLEGRTQYEVWEQLDPAVTGPSWWTIEPNVGRVVNGLPARVDRIRGLGNAVVPLQARTAFQILMGLQ